MWCLWRRFLAGIGEEAISQPGWILLTFVVCFISNRERGALHTRLRGLNTPGAVYQDTSYWECVGMFLRCWNECALGSVFQYWFCTKPSDYDVVVFQGAWSKDSDAGVVLSRGWLNTALSTVFMTSAFSSLLAMTAGSVIQFQVCQDATYVISRREARERRDTCGIGIKSSLHEHSKGSPVCTVTPPVRRWFWVRTRVNFSSATTSFLGAGQAGDVSQKVG
ncbi:hypothetical protein V5799_032520 [Amblyomma americanum]|uniref:Uncharacterized protein n=1 Tax=Amblyomma americanum TaxID=6943 RepID=A0AAQ4DQY1_AMBAM